MSAAHRLIPCGWADFRAIRLERRLYVDKTRFLRPLEDRRFVFLIRPRRFGKSCWVSLLENYYDRNRADEFEAVFGGTDIGCAPTANRHRYVILRFDFSVVNDAPETLEEEFGAYCRSEIEDALERNADLFPEAAVRAILSPATVHAKLNALFRHARRRGVPLYVLIDEYDDFANTILARQGPEAYEALTHGGGFYRNFFAVLKGAAGRSGGGLERLFVTGVSPLTPDDVTSGFNIGANVSLLPEFNEVLGFTEAEVRGLLEAYRADGAFSQDVGSALGLMREWYGGYRFAEDAERSVHNTDMVLYYLDRSLPNKDVPRELVDANVRIDYGKLRHLLVVSRQVSAGEAARLNGNFDLLREVVADGAAEGPIETSFPVNALARRENFLSLLHYFGLLSIREVVAGTPRLGVPNQTVRRLMQGFLRDAYDDAAVVTVDAVALSRLLRGMALRGEWRPVFEYLARAIGERTGVRDYLHGEKVIQGFLAAYLGLSEHFAVRTEAELNKGFADICMEPLVVQHPELRRGYLIELKYLKREGGPTPAGEAAAGKERAPDGGGAGEAPPPDEAVEGAVREAAAQLRRYLADGRLRRAYPSVRFTGVVVVFRAWEMLRCDEAAA